MLSSGFHLPSMIARTNAIAAFRAPGHWTFASTLNCRCPSRNASGLRPPNPRYRFLQDNDYLYDDGDLVVPEVERSSFSSETAWEEMVAARSSWATLREEIADWDDKLEIYFDYLKSKLLVDLREGALQCSGVMIHASSFDEFGRRLKLTSSASPSENPRRSERQNGCPKIDWDKSILYGSQGSYCWVHFHVEPRWRELPGPS